MEANTDVSLANAVWKSINVMKRSFCKSLWVFTDSGELVPPYKRKKKKLQIALPADYKPYANVTLCCGTWIWVWGRVPRLNWRMSVTTVVNQSRVSAPSFTFIFHSCCLFKRKKKDAHFCGGLHSLQTLDFTTVNYLLASKSLPCLFSWVILSRQKEATRALVVAICRVPTSLTGPNLTFP